MHEMHTVVRAWTDSPKMIMNMTMVMIIVVEMIKMEDSNGDAQCDYQTIAQPMLEMDTLHCNSMGRQSKDD